MDKRTRFTTREAASLLGRRPSEALSLLRAVRAPSVRCGSAFLWDAAAVEWLARTLPDRARSECQEPRSRADAP